MANVIQEYVIQLGSQIDNQGVNKILGLLDSSKLKAMKVTGALSALTTAIYKFVESATKREFELEELAKKQKKSIELTRAENTAMQAMGKTLQQINKDQNLKKIYKDIVDFNKEIQMPKVDQSLEKIRNLENAFYKLKSALSYATQYINAEILKNLRKPIEIITKKVNRIAVFLRDKMNIYATKIGLVISDFVKGLMGVGTVLGKIIDYIANLPPGIKAIGAAITGIIALIKSGPIGQLITLITLVGDFIHDYENFKWNQENGLKKGDEGYVGNLNDRFGIWDAFEKEGFSGMGQLLVDKINEGLLGLDAESLGEGFGAFLERAFAKLDEIISGGGEGGLFGSLITLGKTLGKKIFEFLHKAMDTISESEIKTHIANIIRNVFSKLSSGLTKLLHVAIGEKGADGQYKEGLLQYGKKLFLDIISFISEGAKTIGKSELGTELGDFINQIFTSIGEFLSTEEVPTGELLKAAGNIAEGILKTINKSLSQLLEKDEEGKTGIQKFVEGLFDFLSNSINNLFNATQEEGFESGAESIGETLGSVIGKAIKIGAEFLEEFVTEAITWISRNGDKLLAIGKAIVNAIGAAFRGLIDALLTEIFGEDWLKAKRGAEAKQVIEDELFVDEETGEEKKTVTGASGKEYTKGEAEHLVEMDADYARQELNITERTANEAFINTFFEKVGIGSLTTTADKRTVGSGNVDFPEEMIAKMFGIKYNRTDSSITGENGQRLADDFEFDSRDYLQLVKSIADAKDANELTSALKDMSNFLVEIGAKAEGTKFDDALLAAAQAATEQEAKIKYLNGEFTTLAESVGDLGTAIDIVVKSAGKGGGNGEGEAGEAPKAYGGRIGTEGHFIVGEDGAEYIIPITKRARAFQLIDQMLSEMGTGAIQHIQDAFGIGNTAAMGTIGGSIESIIGSLGGGSNFSISAPVNIYVTATGSDAKEIGTAAYDAAERHLVKTLRGVYA